jgi:hypothetical protein
MDDDGPTIVRPVPRRPFHHILASPTPPEDDSAPPSPAPDSQDARMLYPGAYHGDKPSMSRLQSFNNLTSPTLLGIYSPTVSAASDRPFFDRDEPDTPWGTGAQTPIKRPDMDDATYELIVDRSHVTRRRSSFRSSEDFGRPPATPSMTSRGLRAAVLFLLGVGYGTLVTHFHEGRGIGNLPAGIIKPGYNHVYLTFWGVAGALLGTLLPWFDTVWEQRFDGGSSKASGKEAPSKENEADTGKELALVVRAIGAFVGIAFAIRRLAWDSTLQASATLALVNPLLWWLIDRSIAGFLLATAVGITGSLFLLGVDPEMMPSPSTVPARNASARADAGVDAGEILTLGGMARQETVEAGIWMLSMLFCSCVCFGSIGRRLMGSSARAGPGR